MILTGIGAVFSERSGVIGLGVEGLMIVGAFTSIIVSLELHDVFGDNIKLVAVIAAGLAGMIFSLFIAVGAVSFRADQTVTGVAINMLALAVTVFLVKMIYDRGQTDIISTPISLRICGMALNHSSFHSLLITMWSEMFTTLMTIT